jgi:hypothetical protein
MDEKFYRIVYKLNKDVDLNKHWLFEGKKNGYFQNLEEFYKKFYNLNFKDSNSENKSKIQEYIKIRHFLKIHSFKLEYQPYYDKILFEYINNSNLESTINKYNLSLTNNLILIDFIPTNKIHLEIVKYLKELNNNKFNSKFKIEQLKKNNKEKYNLCKYFINLKDDIDLDNLVDFYNLNIIILSVSSHPKYLDYILNFKSKEAIEKILNILESEKSFDIIIPCYNIENYIENTLKSLYAQTYKKFNIYIIDDKSTDSTLDILKKYENIPNIKIISNKINLGKYVSINGIIGNLKSDYFLILDSDDIITKNRLLFDLLAFVNKSILLVQSKYYRYNEITKNITHEPNYGENIITFDRKIIGMIGKYYNTRFGGDTEYLERALTFLGDEVMYQINKITYVAIIRKDESNLTKTIGKKDRIRFVRKYRKLHELNNVNFFINLCK